MNHRHARAPLSLILAAAIAALAGCQNMSPPTQTEVITPLPFGNGGSQAQPIDLSGRVMMGETPFADADVRIVDAMTNADVRIVAPGGGNVVAPGGGNVVAPGGGNVVAAGGANLKTDAEGRFSVQLAGLTPGQVVRITASRGGETLATLVSADGRSLVGGRSVQALQTSFELSLASTMITALADTGLRLAKTLTPKAANAIVGDYFDQLQAQMPFFSTYVLSNMPTVRRVLQGFDPATGTMSPDSQDALSTALSTSGQLQIWLDFNRGTIMQILELLKTGSNISPDLINRLGTLKDLAIPGTGLSVSLDENFLTIVRAEQKDAAGNVTQPAKRVTIDVTQHDEIQKVVASGEFIEIFTALKASL